MALRVIQGNRILRNNYLREEAGSDGDWKGKLLSQMETVGAETLYMFIQFSQCINFTGIALSYL
jgi:hypothetical protein